MIQFLIDGLVNGSIIALGAVGLSISYNVMRFANFAQGEVMAVGAYVSLGVLALMGLGIGKMGPVSFGWPLLVSILFSIMMTSIVVLITDLLVFRRLRDKDSSRITFIIVAFGISLIARNVIHLVAGGDQQFYSFYIPRAVQVFEGVKIKRFLFGGFSVFHFRHTSKRFFDVISKMEFSGKKSSWSIGLHRCNWHRNPPIPYFAQGIAAFPDSLSSFWLNPQKLFTRWKNFNPEKRAVAL